MCAPFAARPRAAWRPGDKFRGVLGLVMVHCRQKEVHEIAYGIESA